jgi:HK97 family phage prohead protease
MNLYERVKRGDVDQCSFGFDIRSEDTDIREDGSIHWTLREVDLFEVSCCTFPAYEETSISARTHEREEIQKRELTAWKENAKKKLKGE